MVTYFQDTIFSTSELTATGLGTLVDVADDIPEYAIHLGVRGPRDIRQRQMAIRDLVRLVRIPDRSDDPRNQSEPRHVRSSFQHVML